MCICSSRVCTQDGTEKFSPLRPEAATCRYAINNSDTDCQTDSVEKAEEDMAYANWSVWQTIGTEENSKYVCIPCLRRQVLKYWR